MNNFVVFFLFLYCIWIYFFNALVYAYLNLPFSAFPLVFETLCSPTVIDERRKKPDRKIILYSNNTVILFLVLFEIGGRARKRLRRVPDEWCVPAETSRKTTLQSCVVVKRTGARENKKTSIIKHPSGWGGPIAVTFLQRTILTGGGEKWSSRVYKYIFVRRNARNTQNDPVRQ